VAQGPPQGEVVFLVLTFQAVLKGQAEDGELGNNVRQDA